MTSAETTAGAEWLTLDEIADVLRVHQPTVRKWARQGTIPAAKFGGVYRVSRADFDAFVRAARVTS